MPTKQHAWTSKSVCQVMLNGYTVIHIVSTCVVACMAEAHGNRHDAVLSRNGRLASAPVLGTNPSLSVGPFLQSRTPNDSDEPLVRSHKIAGIP